MKQYFLLLCMICCLFVISCADESAKTGASYEAEVPDNTFCFPSSRMCETEEAYYGVGSGDIQYIQFMDKKSRVSGVLCGKSVFQSDGWFLLHCLLVLLHNGKLEEPNPSQRKSLMIVVTHE